MIRARYPLSRIYWPILANALILASLYFATVSGYILFHSIAEIFAVVISCAVFTLAWNTRSFSEQGFLLFVGIALLAASALNILHVLSYQGMGVFAGRDAEIANLSTQLWLARRYLESIALLIAPTYLRRRLNGPLALVIFGAVTTLLLGMIFGGWFPQAYAEGRGLTPFKIDSEYVITALFLVAAYRLYRERERLDARAVRGLIPALVISAGAEVLFTLYVGVYDLPNRLGHFLTIVAYYLIYQAIVRTGVVKPYTLLANANLSLSQRGASLRVAMQALSETASRLQAEVAARKEAQATLARQGEWLRSLHEIDKAILRAQSAAGVAAAAARSLVAATSAVHASVVTFDAGGRRAELLAADGAGQDLPETELLRTYRMIEERRQGSGPAHVDVDTVFADDECKSALQAAGIHGYTSIPLVFGSDAAGTERIGTERIGMLLLGQGEPGPLQPDVLAFVIQVADQLSAAIHHARLNDETLASRQRLQVLSRRLVQVQEDERRSLSRDLHDTSSQAMTALRMELSLLKREVGCDEAAGSRIDELRQVADTVAEDLHRLSVNLRPASLDRYGLVPAVEQLIASTRRQTGIEVGFLVQGMDGPASRLSGDTETALFRIIQEACTNISRYAEARNVSVIVQRRAETVQVIVEDDGRGFDVEEALRRGRLGLLGMRERAEMLGGTFTIESTPGAGTTLYVEVPVTAAGEAVETV